MTLVKQNTCQTSLLIWKEQVPDAAAFQDRIEQCLCSGCNLPFSVSVFQESHKTSVLQNPVLGDQEGFTRACLWTGWKENHCLLCFVWVNCVKEVPPLVCWGLHIQQYDRQRMRQNPMALLYPGESSSATRNFWVQWKSVRTNLLLGN